jgi:lipoprotein-releasing system ATP-binding protein
MSTLASPISPPPSAKGAELLVGRGLKKTFRMGEARVEILRDANLTVRAGEFIAIEGRSGSGKSTLLHILGALDQYDGGSVVFDGRDFSKLSGSQRSDLRNRQFGFVFQFYHLLPEFNVLENTMLAAMIEFSWLKFRRQKAGLRARAIEILESLGLSHRLRHKPKQLSGGERQRVAIARALMNRPRILFADEPTGNLDFETGRQIMRVLEDLHARANQTIIMVTHDRSVAQTADRVLVLENGVIRAADGERK